MEAQLPHGKGELGSPPALSAHVVSTHVYCGETVAHLGYC